MAPAASSPGQTRDRRAWTADTIDEPSTWRFRLPPSCWALLDEAVSRQRTTGRATREIGLGEDDRATLADICRPALAEMESGRGFIIIDGLDLRPYTDEEAKGIYWLVGEALGEPVAQNVQGSLLYDVRDTSQDVAQGARFSVTNAESGFHTDNSFGEGIVDYVGLLCLRTARSGGRSQLVSGYTVCRELQRGHPEALRLLCEPYHVDRRGGVREGESPTAQRPVLDWDDGGLTLRYLRYWIQAGHERIGRPLTPEQRRALDTLDQVVNRPDLRVEFDLEPGQMLWANNRWTFHNRTAFEDHAEPERRRHYIRLWIRAR